MAHVNKVDIALVLDRCDQVLGSSSLRAHSVADESADAYWPALAVAALVVEGRVTKAVREKVGRLDDVGIKAVVVALKLAHDSDGTAIRKLREILDEERPQLERGSLDPARERRVLLALCAATGRRRRAVNDVAAAFPA